jgi:hypothetical protein
MSRVDLASLAARWIAVADPQLSEVALAHELSNREAFAERSFWMMLVDDGGGFMKPRISVLGLTTTMERTSKGRWVSPSDDAKLCFLYDPRVSRHLISAGFSGQPLIFTGSICEVMQ